MPKRLDARYAADLWFFRVAAETESFARAADQLAVTQSAVTQRIQRLEARLDLELFKRGTRGLSLTAVGRVLFESARDGFDGMDASLRRLVAKPDNISIQVSCVPSLALEWLTPRLIGFMANHPDIDVALFGEMQSLDRGRMVSEGIDVAIRYGHTSPSGALVAFDHPETLFPVSSSAYRAEFETAHHDRPTVLLHDATPWLPTDSPTDEWACWQKVHGMPWGRPSQNLFFNLAQMAYQSAMSGVGLAMGRSLIVRPLVKSGRLVAALDQEPIGGLRYYVSTQTLALDGAVGLFIGWLQREMSADSDRATLS